MNTDQPLGRTGPFRRLIAAAVLAAGLSAAGGCNAIINGWFDPTTVGSFSNETTLDIRTTLSIQDTPAGIAGATDPAPEDLIPSYEEYRVGPGDQLAIRVFEMLARGTETNVQSPIDEIGTISIPVLGPIRVAGMTRSEIERELIRQLAARGILQEAQLTVEVAMKRDMIYTVYGATPQPNVYPIPRPDTRLLEALNIAGGLVDTVTDVYVIRKGRTPASDRITGWRPDRSLSRADRAREPVAARLTGATLSDGYGGTSGATGPGGRQPPDDEVAEPVPGQPTESGPANTDRDDLLEAIRPGPTEAKPTAPSVSLQEELAPAEPTSQPRWMYVNGEWIETGTRPPETAPTPAERPGRPPVETPAPPAPAEPQIDWSRLAGEEERRVIRVSAEGLRNGDYRQNIVVRQGDMIRVMAGQVGEYYIMGQINRPGAYSLTGRQITLKSAVAAAGNLGVLAWPDRCTIYRRYGDREEMRQINLDAVFAGKEPDVLLKNNDLILVGTHPAAPFLAVVRNAFRMTYGFGFVYDRNFADVDSYNARPNPEVTELTNQGSRFPNLFR